MITPQIQAAINHLQSLLDDQAEIQKISINRNDTAIVSIQTDAKYVIVDVYKRDRDLIQEVLKDVSENPDICLDCMTDDNMGQSPFFVHMMNAYIKNLIIGYGQYVPISKAMALYFMKHNLLNGFTIFHKLASGTIIPLNEYTESICDTDNFMLSLYDEPQ